MVTLLQLLLVDYPFSISAVGHGDSSSGFSVLTCLALMSAVHREDLSPFQTKTKTRHGQYQVRYEVR